nr:MAG: hypothetical protein [Bacteriophage sp.]
MKKHYETHVEDTDKLISVAGPILEYKSWYEQYRKLMEEQAQRKYGLYTPTSEGDDDDFPSIPGITARYSALGLTNEQMAENPVWKDLTGNGHDLQMKNFAWGGMSGVGGYVDNWNSSADWGINNYWVNSHTDHKLQFITASTVVQVKSKNIYNAENVYKNILKVNGLTEAVNKGSARGLRISATDSITSKEIKTFSFDTDGVIQISFDDVLQDYYVNYFVNGNNTNDIDITIEQLPLYPGALVFDGVDDYGVCDNFPILTKEKGYTVVALRQWITYNPNAISAIATNASDQSFNGAFTFENYNKGAEQTISYGATQITLQYSKSPFSWQTTSKYNGVNIANGNKDATNSLVLGRSYPQRNEFANFAIWELVFLDHDATEEELTKIKDYFVKTYPWLFPDQAWTVTGKTNEDEDRATIANITGNGNNLVLSNFGFAEGSGYNEEGEYAGYLVTDGVDDKIISSIFKMGNDWTVIGDWELINTGKNDNAGIVKFDSIVIYNYNYNSMLINIKNGRNILIPDQNTVNAICSDGRIYSKDWKESIYNEETESTSKNFLTIGYSGNAYTKIAFKNLAIYPTVLSREDCIKAYNYLQTLKAK